jgi:hypothetical protein
MESAAQNEQSDQKIEHSVIVHKASIPLAKGESISQFTQKLSDAGRKALYQKLNLTPYSNTVKDGSYSSVYNIEAFAGSAVYEVYSYKGNGGGSDYKYYAMKYARNEAGDFSFSDLTEVVRTIGYKPKSELEVTKAVETVRSEHTTGVSRPPEKSIPVTKADAEVDVWKSAGWEPLFRSLL